MLEWTHYYPSATLAPDWDVLQAVIMAMKQFPVLLTLKHIQGHHDNAYSLTQ